jgi:ribosomal protein L11 methyltransferase
VTHPALDVVTDESEILLALADDYSPIAAEERDGILTIYFDSCTRRDEACDALMRARPSAAITPREVDDGDWARRSQANLTPVTVGWLTIAPPWHATPSHLPALVIIEPSMGFGTGHHATTRLCLRALQEIDLSGTRVLDVGTGSGVLAMAARVLGASEGLGIDVDPDAVESARANLRLNPGIARGGAVRFEVCDIRNPEARSGADRSDFDVVAANLTGALLRAAAGPLHARVRPGGRLILSGLLAPERSEVLSAFTSSTVEWEATEEEWVALVLRT